MMMALHWFNPAMIYGLLEMSQEQFYMVFICIVNSTLAIDGFN